MGCQKNTRFFLLYLSCLVILTTGRATAQQGTSKNYVVSHWDMTDGLPQSSVNDILQSQDGYLWLATYGGLVRFDGVSFTTYDRSNTRGMRSDRILKLYEDRSGNIWLSSESGFIRYKNGLFESYLLSEESLAYTSTVFVEDAYGRLWLSVNGKPYLFNGDAFEVIPISSDTLLKQKALEDTTGAGVWIAQNYDILKTYDDSIVRIANLRSEIKSEIVDYVEYPEGSGILFIATSKNGVLRIKDNELTFYGTERGLSSPFLRELYVDRTETLWATSYNGINRWNGSKFVSLDAIKAPKDIQYTGIYEDNEGNYWIGTTSQGFLRLRPSIITTIDREEGLWNEKMLSLTKLSGGSYLFATNCGGVYEWDGNRAIEPEINKYLPNLCVWSVFEDSKGQIWFGSRVLYRSNSLDEPGVTFDAEDGFTGTQVFAITEDSEGKIWVGCINGVYVYDGTAFKKITTADGLSYNDIRAFYEDDDGRMWVGTSQGLNTINNGVVNQVRLLENSPNSTSDPKPYIRAIYKDDEGTIWLGSYGNGMFRLKNGKVKNITEEEGLYDNIVSHIVEDEAGNFWIGSNNGIFRVSKDALNKVADGLKENVRSYSYGVGDGMNSAETNGGFQPNVIEDQQGKVIFSDG